MLIHRIGSLFIIKYTIVDNSLIGREISLNEYFDRIVTLDDVKMPKPDPEVYQQLINFYAVPPEKVLVFEDSLLGTTAAKTTGTTVIAIEDAHNTEILTKSEICRLQYYGMERTSILAQKLCFVV